MIEGIVVAVVYAIGYMLCYGRVVAIFYEVDEMNLVKYGLMPTRIETEMYLSLLSWVGFFVGVMAYFMFGNKYFLKWHKDDLFDKHIGSGG